ncbi:hypothetical protein LINGRAHAP2_LOCUS35685 [Linum grandiflorum]
MLWLAELLGTNMRYILLRHLLLIWVDVLPLLWNCVEQFSVFVMLESWVFRRRTSSWIRNTLLIDALLGDPLADFRHLSCIKEVRNLL